MLLISLRLSYRFSFSKVSCVRFKWEVLNPSWWNDPWLFIYHECHKDDMLLCLSMFIWIEMIFWREYSNCSHLLMWFASRRIPRLYWHDHLGMILNRRMHYNPSWTFNTYNEIKLLDNSMASGPQQLICFTNNSYDKYTIC